MPKLFINEEYGYREYTADLTDAEWEDLKRRWATIKGLNPLVPVKLIVPQAKDIVWEEFNSPTFGRAYCEAVDGADFHMHVDDWDDSWLDSVPYAIPKTEDESFHIDGRIYTYDQIKAMMFEERETGAFHDPHRTQ